MWTRVKSLDQLRQQQVRVFNAVADLKFDRNIKTLRQELQHDRGGFIFDPADFKDQAAGFTEAAYRLPAAELLEYGHLATRLRQRFTEKAAAARAALTAALPDGEEQKDFAEPKLYRGRPHLRRTEKAAALMPGFEAGPPCRRRKKRKKKETLEELAAILSSVRRGSITQKEAADQFGVAPHLVMNLVRNEKLGRSSVAQLKEKRAAKAAHRQAIAASVQEHVERHWNVWTRQQIRHAVVQSGGGAVTAAQVGQVLRDDYNMSYRRLRTAAYQGNSQRCLVTRMLYAKKMLALLEAGKRVINVDETWLPHLDFRTKKWRRRGEANTLATKALAPKVNMIAALDTDGRLYLSLT